MTQTRWHGRLHYTSWLPETPLFGAQSRSQNTRNSPELRLPAGRPPKTVGERAATLNLRLKTRIPIMRWSHMPSRKVYSPKSGHLRCSRKQPKNQGNSTSKRLRARPPPKAKVDGSEHTQNTNHDNTVGRDLPIGRVSAIPRCQQQRLQNKRNSSQLRLPAGRPQKNEDERGASLNLRQKH